ncbi:HAMP domain-containing histidine kinase [Draconibacterium sp.]|nr:HAMP domain-containing histidine kinase [Draconibacterium sp.]
MNQKLKPASRLSVVFILVVVLSGSILTWFSINNISNQKVLTEKRIQEEQRELSVLFSDVLQKQIETVTAGFSNEISPIGLLKDSLVKKAAEFDFIIQPFILASNGDFIYPNFAGMSENSINPKFSGRFKTEYYEGEKAEFAENNLKAAWEKYLKCLQISTSKIDSVKALNAVGRVSMKLQELENAIQHYNTIVLTYFNVSDENGVPYIYYAVPQLLKITTAGNIEKQLPIFECCFEKMEKGEIPLNINTKDWLTQSINSLQEITVNNPGKLENIKTLETYILQQLQFVDEYRSTMSELLKKGSLDQFLNVGNDFKIVNSISGNSQKLLLINTNFTNLAGFLIDGEKLYATVIKTGLQSGFEFEYKIEFVSGYNSNSTKNNLVYSSQLNPYFPEQVMQIKLIDENLINDLIQRRSWIYGISTILLLVAMILGVVLIVRDISREKHLARLQSDFISNVTHELKTPLTSISMFTESMLLKRVKKDSDKEEYLSIILKESERLKRMINNILEFSKLEKGKSDYRFVNSNLAAIVNTAIQEFDYWFEKEGFEVVSELDDKIEAKVDPEKMKQVFENLLNNSIKYSTINKKIFTRLFMNTDKIHIEIEDHGIGIPEKEISKIFEKFYRINHKDSISGTGLGLTVVNEIVQAHDGKIEVDSEVGKGSKFSIILNQQKENM